MAAVAVGLKVVPWENPVVIFTDCLVLLDILACWQHMDFGPYVEAEANWDILEDVLNGLLGRQAVTVVAWIPAHRGDLGNGRADMLAGTGCFMEDTRWDHPTYPMRLFDLASQRDLVSPHGWTGGAERHARVFQGELKACSLAASDAGSTRAMLLPGRGQEIVGQALRHVSHSPRGLRDYLQLWGGCFPTNAVLTRYLPTASLICPLCGRGEETNAHMFMVCPALADVISAAHNMIADAIAGSIAAHLACGATLLTAPLVGSVTKELLFGRRRDGRGRRGSRTAQESRGKPQWTPWKRRGRGALPRWQH